MTDHTDLKAIAEACKAQQPLRFMQHGADLCIRNDIGVVFHVVQNHRFPDFKAQNKNYADLVLAATPEVILGLLDKIAMLEPALEGYASGEHAAQVADELGHQLGKVEAELDALKSEVEELRKNSDRYVWLRDKSESFNRFYISVPAWLEGVKFRPEAVDEGIDRAMALDATVRAAALPDGGDKP